METAAREAGFSDVSERLVTDWVSLGLLDQPHRTARGKGNGRGAFYEWSDIQRDLFHTLLLKRPEAKHRGALCAIPVGIWMYWERRVDTTPPGAPRAKRTWWDRAGRVGWERSLEAARLVVDTFGPAGTTRAAKSRLRWLIAGALESHVFPREEVAASIGQFLGAMSSDGAWGPYRTPAAEVVDGMWSMTVAIERYEELTIGMFQEGAGTAATHHDELRRRLADPAEGPHLRQVLRAADVGLLDQPVMPSALDRTKFSCSPLTTADPSGRSPS